MVKAEVVSWRLPFSFSVLALPSFWSRMLDVAACCGSSLWRKQRALKKARSVRSWAPLPWWGHSVVRASCVPQCRGRWHFAVRYSWPLLTTLFCRAAAVLFGLLLNNRFGFAYLHVKRCSSQRMFRGVCAQKDSFWGDVAECFNFLHAVIERPCFLGFRKRTCIV